MKILGKIHLNLGRGKMEIKHFDSDETVKTIIQRCQNANHLQQVAFSTYHNCLTQICFTCGDVRTSLNDWKDAEDIKSESNQSQGERARTSNGDNISSEMNYDASESTSNKRDIGNPDTNVEDEIKKELLNDYGK